MKAAQPVPVQTDVLEASLQRFGEVPRHQTFRWIVSVAELPDVRSYHILAAHPFFLPTSRCPDIDETDGDRNLPLWLRRWDAMEHLHQIKLDGFAIPPDGLPDVSRNGLFVHSPYAELAHFLVVDGMLRRFPRVHYVMDDDKALCAAALTALRRSVLAGRVEAAAFQHDKEAGRVKRKASGRPGRADSKSHLAKAWRAAESRLEKRLNPDGELPLGVGAGDAKVLAGLFRSVFKGTYSATGGWAWLEHPPESMQYARPCVRPDDAQGEARQPVGHGLDVPVGAGPCGEDELVAKPLEEQGGIARAFAEFALLPDMMFLAWGQGSAL